MTKPQSCIKPYTEHKSSCSSYDNYAKREQTFVYSLLDADARSSPEEVESMATSNMDERVRHAITIMEQYLHRHLNLNEIANHVNLSLWHFSHLFKNETDMSPAQYLKTLRLRKAKELLESTFLSFKEIKCRVGIKDESHFARSFKSAFGIPPTQYRARFLSSRVSQASLAGGIAETARK